MVELDDGSKQVVSLEEANPQTMPQVSDIGKNLLCWDYTSPEPVMCEVTQQDVELTPLIVGFGKKARLMGTLGCVRGLGDHLRKARGTNILMKPLLITEPEEKYYTINLSKGENKDKVYEILILASDGLWDVLESDIVVEEIQKLIYLQEQKKLKDCNQEQKILNIDCRIISERLVKLARDGREKIEPEHNEGKEIKPIKQSGDDITIWICNLGEISDFSRISKINRIMNWNIGTLTNMMNDTNNSHNANSSHDISHTIDTIAVELTKEKSLFNC